MKISFWLQPLPILLRIADNNSHSFNFLYRFAPAEMRIRCVFIRMNDYARGPAVFWTPSWFQMLSTSMPSHTAGVSEMKAKTAHHETFLFKSLFVIFFFFLFPSVLPLASREAALFSCITHKMNAHKSSVSQNWIENRQAFRILGGINNAHKLLDCSCTIREACDMWTYHLYEAVAVVWLSSSNFIPERMRKFT